MVKPPTFDSNGMKKGAWSKEEDERLRAYIDQFGHHNWRLLPSVAGLARCGKSCRLRWVNYLKPGLRKGKFTKHEEDLVITLHHQLGNKWSTMAAKMPGRTDNEIKNYWHAHIKKRGRGGGNAGHAATTRASKLKEEDQDQDQDQESSSSGLMINSCDDDENPKNIDALNPIADLYALARADEDDDLSHQTGLSQLINNVDLPPLFPEGELRDFELFQEMQNDSSNSSLSFSDGFCSPRTAEFRGNFWFESFAEDMLDMVLW